MSIVNISGYKFIALENLKELKEKWMPFCLEHEIKGTMLLSPEGINLNLAATRQNIDAFKQMLTSDARFSDYWFKESVSEYVPFRRMKIKLKKEIISMSAQGICKHNNQAPVITPETLKKWYDEGKEFTILDTRNDYEIAFGSFENAKVLPIEDFRHFPEAVEKSEQLDKDAPIVTFCTGGVRCEKAVLAMEERGYKEVYQLEGGILNYFEKCHGEHWDGSCFVFDRRVALDGDLKSTGELQCENCRFPVSAEDQKIPEYESGICCPRCAGHKIASDEIASDSAA